ncbi:hypothetical protein [Polaribacter atrinae]|uniref:hypothetical protein n=1 Tax=Polaribacter atrinae TaxID=1333662 RepID=UPI002491BDB9|nr:hypothetical protein [Polaribacter atrinae]
MRQLSKEMKQVNYCINKRSISTVLLCLFLLLSAQYATAQNDLTNDEYQAFSVGANVKNMHLWHGSVVHPGAMIATSIEYNSKNKKFTFGFWGGASFSTIDVENNTTGKNESAYYKEVSIYTKYRFSDAFFIEAVSHNNYTGVEERGDELQFWSYDKTQGYNFVDVSFGYNVTPNTLLYLATIVNGGSGDYEIQTDGSLKNSWTHYFEVQSKVWQKRDASLSLFAGGAWSFITDKTFYTNNAGNIINVGATLNKDVKIGTYKLPIGVTAMWNPEQEKIVLQLDIALF